MKNRILTIRLSTIRYFVRLLKAILRLALLALEVVRRIDDLLK